MALSLCNLRFFAEPWCLVKVLRLAIAAWYILQSSQYLANKDCKIGSSLSLLLVLDSVAEDLDDWEEKKEQDGCGGGLQFPFVSCCYRGPWWFFLLIWSVVKDECFGASRENMEQKNKNWDNGSEIWRRCSHMMQMCAPGSSDNLTTSLFC
jgi:hypothetical protein